MYLAVLELENNKFKGTLDMFVLKRVQEDLLKMNIKTTVPNIFKSISEEKMEYISSLILNSLARVDERSSEIFLNIFLSYKDDDEKLIVIFESMFIYLNELFNKCLQKQIKKKESIFEDDLLFNDVDWEFDYMEYIWSTTIGRNDNFWNITPKNFFEQVTIYKKINNIKDKEIEEI